LINKQFRPDNAILGASEPGLRWCGGNGGQASEPPGYRLPVQSREYSTSQER